jgi:hypothetical protein
MYIEALIKDIENRLSFILRGKNWLWKITIVAILLFVLIDFGGNISKLVYFRTMVNDFIKQGTLDTTHSIIKAQSEDYFAFFKKGRDIDIASYEHEAKMKFRLFLPTLVRIIGAKHFDIWLYVLGVVVGFFYIHLVAKMTLRILGAETNRLVILIFVVGFTNLYAGGGSFVLDIIPYGDFFAYLFLFLSIYYRNSVAIFLCCQCAFWVDERALVNAAYVIVWWSFIDLNKSAGIRFKITTQAIVVVLSGILYMGIRRYLTIHHHLPDSIYTGEFISTFYENMKMISLRVWAGFEGFWLLVLLCLWILIKEKKYQFLVMMLGTIAISVGFALIAFDANRGISYGFIVLFMSLVICKKYLSESELKYLLLVCCIVALLSPTLSKYRIVGGTQLM